MMNFSLISRLMSIGLLVGTVGCYSTIPAVKPGPVGVIVREISQDNSYTSRTYGKNPERLMVDGKAVDVYFVESHEYSYNPFGLIIHERFNFRQSVQNTEFTYTSGKLITKTVYTNGSGTVTGVYSATAPLNDQGYDARNSYDAEGIASSPRSYTETRANGNPIQLLIDDDGLKVTLKYTYDLTHLSMPSPRQFEGKSSRNLLQTASNTRFNCCASGRSEYRYQFDSNDRVSRRIILSWRSEFPDGSPPATIYVTDYQYACI